MLQSSLSVNTYTDQTINSQPVDERVSDLVNDEDKRNKEDQPPINRKTVDNSKGQLVEQESDKWKPVANSKISNDSKKDDDRLAMPPPLGGFMFKKPSIPSRDRVFPGEVKKLFWIYYNYSFSQTTYTQARRDTTSIIS